MAEQSATPVVAYLASLSASGVDAEIRQLGMEMLREEIELGLFLDFLAMALPSRMHFDLLQAYMGLFLKVQTPIPCMSLARPTCT